MSPVDAAALVQQARNRARHELTINRPVIFVSWALCYLLGYGAVWLSVRGERPYEGPAGWALALLVLLAIAALAVTAQVTDRATRGVEGLSTVQRRIYWLSLAAGWLGVIVMEGALRHQGASQGMIGVFTAASPLLVAGVVLVAVTAAWLNWYLFALGVWLIGVAGFSSFAGPEGVWGIDALAVGLPFLVMGGLVMIRDRR